MPRSWTTGRRCWCSWRPCSRRSEHALIGGIAAGYHGRLRATIDVDLLVPRSKLVGIGRALQARGYLVIGSGDHVRVYPADADPERDDAIANLVAREANPVLDAAFDETEAATILGQPIRVVRRGALVALKFHATTSQDRRHADRLQDVVDIERIMVRQFDANDEALAVRIAGLAYDGAADELRELLDDLRAGRPVTI